MSAPTLLSTVWCNDEDIAVRAYGDYAVLVPSSQVLASGSDGSFAANLPWILTSASVNFQAQGVQVGNVLQITGPTPIVKGSGQIFGVSAVSGTSVTLRQIGQPDGVGQGPGPVAGVSGVSFVVKTFAPQSEDVSYELNSKFGIDPNFALTAPNLIYDPRQLKQACVTTVLYRAFTTSTRTKDGDYAIKRTMYERQMSDALAIVQVRWNQFNENPPPSTRFSTRIGRG